MGFFDIFKKKDDTIDEPEPADNGSSGVLRTVRNGGYDKMSVLNAMDHLNEELLALEQAKALKEKGEPYSLPETAHEIPLKNVRMGGFSCEDVDAMLSDLKERINSLRAQL